MNHIESRAELERFWARLDSDETQLTVLKIRHGHTELKMAGSQMHLY